jgi:hypothetical protein
MRSPSRRFVRYRDVREERVDAVLFLIDQEHAAIHALAPVGAGIWSLLREPASIAETKQVLKQAFPTVPSRRIARDVEEIFAEFEESGLIRHAR